MGWRGVGGRGRIWAGERMRGGIDTFKRSPVRKMYVEMY